MWLMVWKRRMDASKLSQTNGRWANHRGTDTVSREEWPLERLTELSALKWKNVPMLGSWN